LRQIPSLYPGGTGSLIFTKSSKNWDSHVSAAETVSRGAGFMAIRDRILELAESQPTDRIVDVGSGTGLLSLAIAPHSGHVWAIDSSRAMGDYLRVKAASAGLANIETVFASATSLPLVDGVADAVVSNYCMHELRNEDKLAALAEASRVLKPGGRLVIGDMMFSVGVGEARDRRVILDKLRLLASRGLPGIWRIVKNAARLATGRWEHPAGAAWWREALASSGFEQVEVETLVHEGGIAVARKPG
jgi:ubiquinone/menaquinone biosynthesis C-methylase UbiE